MRTVRSSTRPSVHGHAQARPVHRDGDHAGGIHRPLGRHDVALPVAGARADVAGQGEIRERGERDVAGAANAALQHAAAPDGDRVAPAEVVDRPGLREAADPSGLDVHDPSGPQGEHILGRVGVRNRFVEADRRRQPVLELRVPAQVVLRERLLEHQQPVGVEIGKMVGLGRTCRRCWRPPSAARPGRAPRARGQ